MQFHQHFGHVLTFWPLLLLCLEHSSQMFASFISTNVTFSPGPSYEKFGTSILHIYPTPYFSSAHSLRLFATPVDCSTPGFPVQHRLPELAQTHIHWVNDAIQPSHLCHPLLPPSIFSSIRVFSDESVLSMRWPRHWSFSFGICPSNEYSGLISFRMDWLDFLEVQGTLKSLLQHHSSKPSTLRCSAFFIVQLSHPYMSTGKTIALTRWTFVRNVFAF